MGEYSINRGIGNSVEFKGLKSQYLFIFAVGLLAIFVIFIVMYMIGVSQWICIGFGVVATSSLVWLTFHLNKRYGENGLMKLLASRMHPRFILNRRSVPRMFHSHKHEKK